VDETNLEIGAKCEIHHPPNRCFLQHNVFVGKDYKCDLPNLGFDCDGCEKEKRLEKDAEEAKEEAKAKALAKKKKKKAKKAKR
jgi:hypothetical protein